MTVCVWLLDSVKRLRDVGMPWEALYKINDYYYLLLKSCWENQKNNKNLSTWHCRAMAKIQKKRFDMKLDGSMTSKGDGQGGQTYRQMTKYIGDASLLGAKEDAPLDRFAKRPWGSCWECENCSNYQNCNELFCQYMPRQFIQYI